MISCHFISCSLLLLVFPFRWAVKAWEISDVPAPDLFLRRGLANVAVFGNFLYIDGGEVSQLDAEGKPYTLNNNTRGSQAMNSTLSIDLSKSWSTTNVTLREIPKEPHGMDRQALWKREDTNSLYIWGGHGPNTGRLLDESLSTGFWRFQTDGAGGGQWSKETPINPTEFKELQRSEDGAFASTPEGGFWFGGSADLRTRLNRTDGKTNTAVQPTPGMVHYDWRTNQWSNETEEFKAAFPPFGTMKGAKALYVPNYGTSGLVFLLGGFMSTLEPFEDGRNSVYGWMDFSKITFMDPVSKKWFSQNATGPAPTRRQWFCMVGVEGKSSYEIFVFGGVAEYKDTPYDDVFVLSLPGFVWKQVLYDSRFPRTEHHCGVIGKRQMVIVGGRNTTKTSQENVAGWALPDPWPQGLGLFDMKEWIWKSEYNATAEKYESHQEIESWYREIGTASVTWSSDEAKSFFLPKSEAISAGAIAGAVVGAVAGVALLVLMVYWAIRRSRKRPETKPVMGLSLPEERGVKDKAVYSLIQLGEMDARPCRVEMAANSSPQSELPGSQSHAVELDARQDHNRL
ncbi:hypothetical protein BDP81DRAFT_496323 [Colletotrichum phormii]|uniref:Kelch repeat-containing protein n=1 Tax=Colletotrichum phormii TaxID=359342 RepID=A0AAI9ZLY2_9PEZI|nr:uncharacterized protein BDP81DRAFT_496323 [Colletotrichum phormii]KAK1625716.1 hypothetical protein BDP81DRAFT_496323 [Colletotrichum phormii]